MNHQSDFGYSTGAVSMTCIACGKYADGFCCDGHGNPLTELDRARITLAKAMLNQVGVEWEECCDSVEILEKRWRGEGCGDLEIIGRLNGEAYRYEDM